MAGVLGKTKVAIDVASLADGDSIAAYLVDSAGSLLTSTALGGKQRLDVILSAEFAEGSAFTAADQGVHVLGVDSNGDYQSLQFNAATGALLVEADIVNSSEYAEDSAHASGDIGSFVLAVRQDTLASSTSTDGDYAAIKQTQLGEVYTADVTARASLASILSELQAITFAEDSAHASGDLGVMSLAVRSDANAALAASGDYHALILNEVGDLKVSDRMNGTNLQQVVSVGSTATLLPATALTGRKHILIQNNSSTDIYVGSSTVTSGGATQGVLVAKNGHFWEGDVGPANLLYGITPSGTANIVIWELS